MSEKERLKAFREKLGLSRKELAELFERSYQAIKDMEDGKSNIAIDHVKKLSERYHLNPHWLLNGKGDMLLKEESFLSEPKGSYNPPDVNRMLSDLESKHPDSQHIIRRLRENLNQLTHERDELRGKVIKAQEEIIRLIKKV